MYDYLLYNTTTGGLFYDADGSGADDAVQIAAPWTAALHPAITNADFFVF